MEHESFENAEIAALLNADFVSIKVDREERPDVDRVYMSFVQSTTGSGGWPMTVFLTPELKPFFGGTYFPPDVALGPAGLRGSARRARARVEERSAARRAGGGRAARAPEDGHRRRRPRPRRIDDRRARRARRRRRRVTRRPSTSGTAASATRRSFRVPPSSLFLLREHARAPPPATSTRRRCRWSTDTLRAMAHRRHARPHRRRLSPLLGRRGVARAALREDAVRPGAARRSRTSRPRRRPATTSTRRSRKTR